MPKTHPGDGPYSIVYGVHAAELEEISARREKLELAHEAIDAALSAAPVEKPRDASLDEKAQEVRCIAPTTEHGLVGLALSGGGIRSATFNLGVLEMLQRRGVLRHVDYLSTVSGGGYIGSTLSTVLNRDDEPTDREFPFLHRWGERESEAFRHLRNFSNYLAPDGGLDTLRIGALLLRGALVNLAMALPWIVLGAVASAWCFTTRFGRVGTWDFDFVQRPHEVMGVFACTLATLTAVLALLLLVALALKVTHAWSAGLPDTASRRRPPRPDERPEPRMPHRWVLRNSLGRVQGMLLVLPMLMLLWEAQPLFIQELRAALGRLSLVLLGIPLFLLALPALGALRELWGRLVMYGVGLIGPFVLWTVYIMTTSYVLTHMDRGTCEVSLAWAPVDGGRITVLQIVAACVGVMLVFRTLVNVNLTSLHRFYRDRLSRAYLFYWRRPVAPGRPKRDESTADANSTPDLSRADAAREPTQVKIVDQQGGAGEPPPDELKLSELGRGIAPYHLINVALNMQRSRDRALRDRKSDFFLFSKRFVGGPRVGYCETIDLEAMDSNLDLGTAMAISGAAVSPNMGAVTVRPVVFLMGMLNLRLDYWLPNPRKVYERKRRLLSVLQISEDLLQRVAHDHRLEDKERVARTFAALAPMSAGSVGPLHFLRELFGFIDARGAYVNLSDGGHIENLGVYELLRRRCKFIIACDAEADPGYSFGSLAALMRYARIDLACDIDIDVEDIRPGPDGLSRTHCALATIYYDEQDDDERDGPHDGKRETGKLLYIKSSVTGGEPESITEYRTKRPAFPHETTSDQFFTEEQFEAYRHLGFTIAQEAFRMAPKGEVDVEELFESARVALHPKLSTTREFVRLQEKLSELEQQFEKQADYTRQVYPELTRSESDEDLSPEVMLLCNRQLQLMENVFLALDLDARRNRRHNTVSGWLNQFRRWARAPEMRQTWAFTQGNYSERFRAFCETELGLAPSFVVSRDGGGGNGSPDLGEPFKVSVNGGAPPGETAAGSTSQYPVAEFQVRWSEPPPSDGPAWEIGVVSVDPAFEAPHHESLRRQARRFLESELDRLGPSDHRLS